MYDSPGGGGTVSLFPAVYAHVLGKWTPYDWVSFAFRGIELYTVIKTALKILVLQKRYNIKIIVKNS